MLTSLRGVYEDGAVRLTEPAPATSAPVEVVVVFLEANAATTLASEGITGEALPPRDEHMARLRASWQRARALAVGMGGSTLSEEVLAERQEGN